jgi:hypothetical protein
MENERNSQRQPANEPAIPSRRSLIGVAGLVPSQPRFSGYGTDPPTVSSRAAAASEQAPQWTKLSTCMRAASELTVPDEIMKTVGN